MPVHGCVKPPYSDTQSNPVLTISASMFLRCMIVPKKNSRYWGVVIWRTKEFYSLNDLCFIFKNRKAFKMISNTPNPSLQNYFNIYAMFCLFNVEPYCELINDVFKQFTTKQSNQLSSNRDNVILLHYIAKDLRHLH